MIDLTINKNFNVKHLDLIKSKNYKTIYKKNCEVCEKNKFTLLQSAGRIGKPLQYGALKVFICNSCSFKFLNPRYLDSFYKNYYKLNYRKIAFGTFKPSENYINFQKKRGKNIYNYFKNYFAKSGSMLDHGCASGSTMLPWRKNKWECTGIDPHVPSVQYGRKKFKLDIRVAFGEKLPFKNKKFDVVLSLGSLEHSYDLQKTINEIRRTLKDGAHLIIRWRSNKLIGSPLEYFNHNHYRFFNKHSFNFFLMKNNFKVIKHINKPIEGYKSYLYILAQKNYNKRIKKVNNYVYKKEIKYLKKYINKYYFLSKKILKLEKDNFNSNKKKIFIKRNNIHLLNIGKKNAIERFFSETSAFINFIKKYNYIP
jgi:SAM-dependent methyltransferase